MYTVWNTWGTRSTRLFRVLEWWFQRTLWITPKLHKCDVWSRLSRLVRGLQKKMIDIIFVKNFLLFNFCNVCFKRNVSEDVNEERGNVRMLEIPWNRWQQTIVCCVEQRHVRKNAQESLIVCTSEVFGECATMRFNLEQRVFISKHYYLSSCSYVCVCHDFEEKYPGMHLSDVQIKRTIDRFKKNHSLTDLPKLVVRLFTHPSFERR